MIIATTISWTSIVPLVRHFEVSTRNNRRDNGLYCSYQHTSIIPIYYINDQSLPPSFLREYPSFVILRDRAKRVFRQARPQITRDVKGVAKIYYVYRYWMAESNALVSFLSDPATLIGLGVVAAGTAYYMATRPRAQNSTIPLDIQSIEIPVSAMILPRCKYIYNIM